MREASVVGMFLIFALVVVSSDCRRVKRQDLIPFPRVGKRAWNRVDDVTASGRDNMEAVVENMLEQSPLKSSGSDQQDVWGLSLQYPSEARIKGVDNTEDLQYLLRSIVSRSNPSGFSLRNSKRVARKHLRSPLEPLDISSLNSLLVRHLVEQLKTKTPDEIAAYLQSHVNSQEMATAD